MRRVHLLLISTLMVVACGELRQLERKLGELEGVQAFEIRNTSEEDFGDPDYTVELVLQNGGTITLVDLNIEAFRAPTTVQVVEAGGWLPRCATDSPGGWVMSVDVAQSTDSEFLPGQIQNVADAVAKYDLLVRTFAAWPHEAEEAINIRVDGRERLCYAGRL